MVTVSYAIKSINKFKIIYIIVINTPKDIFLNASYCNMKIFFNSTLIFNF